MHDDSILLDIAEQTSFLGHDKGKQLLVNEFLSAMTRQDAHGKVVREKIRQFQIKGFADATKAPPGLIRRACLRLLKEAPPVLGDMFCIWLEMNKDLLETIGSYMDQVEPDELLSLEQALKGEVEDLSANPIVYGLKTRIAEVREEDDERLKLMLSALLAMRSMKDKCAKAEGAFNDPAGEDVPDSQETALHTSLWQTCLEGLSTLPLDAPEWQEAEQFVAALRTLQRTRTSERVRLERLNELLQRARQTLESHARYFHMDDLEKWTAEQVLPDNLARCEDRLKALMDAARGFLDLEQRGTRGSNVEETREKRQALQDAEDRLENAYESLKDSFGPFSGSPASSADVHEPGPSLTLGSSVQQEAVVSPDPRTTLGDTRQAASLAETPLLFPQETTGDEEGGSMGGVTPEPPSPVPDTTDPPPPPGLEQEPEEPVVETEGEPLAGKQEDEAGHFPVREESDLFQRAEPFLLQLVSARDLPGAFWLSSCLEAAGFSSPVPPFLLRAVQASLWSSWDRRFTGDLMQIIKAHSPQGDYAHEMYGIAAALKPSLIDPGSGMVSWFLLPRSFPPALSALLDTFLQFCSRRIPIQPQDVSEATKLEEETRNLEHASREAFKFLEETPQRRFRYEPVKRIVRTLLGERGDLRAMLSPVAQNAQGQRQAVRGHLDNWMREDHAEAQVRRLQERFTRKRTIEGTVRDHLFEVIHNANDIAQRWLTAADRAQSFQESGDWLRSQVRGLKETFSGSAEDILMELKAMVNDGQAREKVAVFTLARALMDVASTLTVPLAESWLEAFPGGQPGWILGPGDLNELFRDRLFLFPEIELAPESYAVRTPLADVLVTMQQANDSGRSLEQATDLWLDRKDFRFIERVLGHLEGSREAHRLSHRYETELEGNRTALREHCESVLELVEQGVVDGIVGDDRSTLLEKVERIRPERTLEFGRMHRVLDEVEQEVYELRRNRLEDLRRNWVTVEGSLEQILDEPQYNTVHKFVSESLAREDTRITEECLSHLSEVLNEQRSLNLELFADPPDPADSPLRDFMSKLDRMIQALSSATPRAALERMQKRATWSGILSYSGLPSNAVQQGIDAVTAFETMRRLPPQRENHVPRIAQVLEFLGFRRTQPSRSDVKRSARDMLHLSMSVSAGNLSRPIPEFGQYMHGSLDVVVLWDRPGPESIASRIEELGLGNKPVIGLYLGRMTMEQRREALRYTREHNLALAILDQVLLVYLTGHRPERLQRFLRCALPFATLNPYIPTGDLPPEMFYGRKDMAAELAAGRGSCLVYGGRQIGKTALLRYVQRQYHQPDQDRFADFKDIKLVGSPMSPTAHQYKEEFWGILRESMKGLGLLPKSIHTAEANRLSDIIMNSMAEHSSRRVLLLLDEADHLLDADSTNGFPVLQDLKRLVFETDRRFKVVFAGLHNVHRFQSIPNHPLAQFGIPIRVGPLEPPDAVQLVREPMQVLGYEMDNPTVLRLLSYTNYHPGLVQFFCKMLLQGMNLKRPARVLPPVPITKEDVEAVYRDANVREEMRQRLDLTLDLDKRYKAIAWSMVYEQREDADSYARSFTPNEVLLLGRGNWPEGFRDLSLERIRILLEEMCGLGVLTKNPQGGFHLRSPNVVRLMGPDVETRILELGEQQREEASVINEQHMPLAPDFSRYSPLTHEQGRALMAPKDFGVSLILASDALGLSALPEAFQQFVPRGQSGQEIAVVREIPAGVIASPDSIKEWLATFLGERKTAEFLLAYAVCRNGKRLPETIQEALDFSRRRQGRSSKHWMKILFLLDANAAGDWYRQTPVGARVDTENRCDASLSPHLWTRSALEQRLHQLEKISSPQACQAILSATGGWPILVDELFRRVGQEPNPASFAEQVKKELGENHSPLRKSFIESIGLRGMAATSDVLNLFLEIPLDEEDLESFPEYLQEHLGKRIDRDLALNTVEYLKSMRVLGTQGVKLQLNEIVRQLL